MKVGRIITRRKVAEHFKLSIAENNLEFARDEASIESEHRLDGFCVVRRRSNHRPPSRHLHRLRLCHPNPQSAGSQNMEELMRLTSFQRTVVTLGESGETALRFDF